MHISVVLRYPRLHSRRLGTLIIIARYVKRFRRLSIPFNSFVLRHVLLLSLMSVDYRCAGLAKGIPQLALFSLSAHGETKACV